MARISGVNVPDNKQAHVALTYIYGIGHKSSCDILAKAKVEQTVRVKDLTDAEIGRILSAIMEVNGLNESMLEEARQSFLTIQAEAAKEQSSQPADQQSTPSGEAASSSASVPQDTKK